jgi:hypothetical protein
MSTNTSPQEEALWQKRFASRANNRAWSLSEQVKRTPEEDEEMLQAAQAAMFLWKSIGTPRNHAHAAQLLAHVYALLQIPKPANQYFSRASKFFTTEQSDPWELALMHTIGANVAFCSGKSAEHARNYRLAEDAIQALPDPEDKEILNATFRIIPRPDWNGSESAA